MTLPIGSTLRRGDLFRLRGHLHWTPVQQQAGYVIIQSDVNQIEYRR